MIELGDLRDEIRWDLLVSIENWKGLFESLATSEDLWRVEKLDNFFWEIEQLKTINSQKPRNKQTSLINIP